VHVVYNLLHLVPGETGGAELYARRLLPALRDADPELQQTVVVGPPAAEEDWGDGVGVVPLRFDPRSRPRRVLAEQTLLPRAVRRSGADLLHNVFNTAPALVSVPQVTTIHDVIHRRHPASGASALAIRALVSLAARRSARVLTVSEASKLDIVRFLGAQLDRIDVAPNGPGIPEDAVGPPPGEIRSRFGVGAAPLVLTVAPNHPHKNLTRLVEALARIPEAVLVVPGYDTNRDDGLGGERVVRPGWVDDATLDGLYRAADCFVLPSLAEGFGLPVLEAMLRGTPVTCSSTTSLPEVVGDAALLFDPTDVEAIAVSVRRILEDRELAGRLRTAGRERAKRFTWAESARVTLDCYRRALR
jgi:glycosyltransferase involved in cell wall biosynthesis